jgi:hypothetical protein
LRQNAEASGAPDVSKFLRAAGLNRLGVGVWHRDLQAIWGTTIDLAGRIGAAPPGREQKAALVAARAALEALSDLIVKIDRQQT